MQDKNLKGFVEKEMKSLIIPMMMLVLGLLFIVLKGGIIDTLVVIVGVLMIIGGGFFLFSLVNGMNPLAIFGGSMLLLFGIVCVTNAFGVSNFVLRLIGFCILVNALLRIFTERTMKGHKEFQIYMINDGITALLGVVLLFLPRTASDVFFVIIGILMMILGVSNVISAYKFYKNGRYISDGSDVVWEE